MSKRVTGLDLPNYTQTPNLIFDELLPIMSNAELRVTMVVIRHTLGWHVRKTEEALPLSEIAKLGGLSLRSAKTGAQEGVQRGTLVRYPCFDEGGRKTFQYALNFKGDPSKLYQVIERPKPTPQVDTETTGANFAPVFKRLFKLGTGAKFAPIQVQILHSAPKKLLVQILHRSYKEQRNSFSIERKGRKKGAASRENPASPTLTSSLENQAAPGEQTGASESQPIDIAPEASLPSQAEHSQVADVENEIWPEGLENVPGERETIHEQPEPNPEAEAVNHRLDQLCNGQWLAAKNGHAQPWIDEVSREGVDRHQIAQVVTLSRIEEFRKEAQSERLDMQVQKLPNIPRVCTLVIRKCEAYLTEHLKRQHLAERAAQPASAQAAAARPVAAAQWYVGDVVSYCLDRYEVVKVTSKHLLLDSEQCGSAQVNLNSSDINKVRLLSRPSLDLDIDGVTA